MLSMWACMYTFHVSISHWLVITGEIKTFSVMYIKNVIITKIPKCNSNKLHYFKSEYSKCQSLDHTGLEGAMLMYEQNMLSKPNHLHVKTRLKCLIHSQHTCNEQIYIHIFLFKIFQRISHPMKLKFMTSNDNNL